MTEIHELSIKRTASRRQQVSAIRQEVAGGCSSTTQYAKEMSIQITFDRRTGCTRRRELSDCRFRNSCGCNQGLWEALCANQVAKSRLEEFVGNLWWALKESIASNLPSFSRGHPNSEGRLPTRCALNGRTTCGNLPSLSIRIARNVGGMSLV